MGSLEPWHLIILFVIFLISVAFLVAIVAIVVAIATVVKGNKKKADTAIDILKERYAKGEIDEEEFRRRKQDLSE